MLPPRTTKLRARITDIKVETMVTWRPSPREFELASYLEQRPPSNYNPECIISQALQPTKAASGHQVEVRLDCRLIDPLVHLGMNTQQQMEETCDYSTMRFAAWLVW